MMTEDFQKKKIRGTWILAINLICCALMFLAWKQSGNFLRGAFIVYTLISIFLFIRRILKKETPTENPNYIFGEKVGNKMGSVPQKFIYEAMMMALTFMIIGDFAGLAYTIISIKPSLPVLIIGGIGGIAGGLFMVMILFTTFQQYRVYMASQVIQQDLSEILKGGKVD